MAKSYKQKLYADLNKMLDRYPGAKVCDVIWALEATTEALWRALPSPNPGAKVFDVIWALEATTEALWRADRSAIDRRATGLRSK